MPDDYLIRPARADDLEFLTSFERAASQVFRGTKHQGFAEASDVFEDGDRVIINISCSD
jgi:hypothetical protein